jgi:hypothetical protein
MSRRLLAMLCCLCVGVTGFAGDSMAREPRRVLATSASVDPDVKAKDVQGIPHRHRYIWAIVGGTAVGTAIGIVAPGGAKSAAKGALIGGSFASFLYLMKNRRAPGAWRSWALVITNAALAGGIGWTICDCGAGFGFGALGGGGATAAIQAIGTKSKGVAKVTGAKPPPSKAPTPAPTPQPPPTPSPTPQETPTPPPTETPTPSPTETPTPQPTETPSQPATTTIPTPTPTPPPQSDNFLKQDLPDAPQPKEPGS